MTKSWGECKQKEKGCLGWSTVTVFLENEGQFTDLLVGLVVTNKCPISSAFLYKTVRRFKRKHLTAIDCQHLARSHLAVTQPFCQRWTNRDPNHGLYPRPRAKRGTRGMSSKQVPRMSESGVCVAFEYVSSICKYYCYDSVILLQ